MVDKVLKFPQTLSKLLEFNQLLINPLYFVALEHIFEVSPGVKTFAFTNQKRQTRVFTGVDNT